MASTCISIVIMVYSNAEQDFMGRMRANYIVKTRISLMESTRNCCVLRDPISSYCFDVKALNHTRLFAYIPIPSSQCVLWIMRKMVSGFRLNTVPMKSSKPTMRTKTTKNTWTRNSIYSSFLIKKKTRIVSWKARIKEEEQKENDLKMDDIAYNALKDQLAKRKEIKLKAVSEQKQSDLDQQQEKEAKLKERTKEEPEEPTPLSALDRNELIQKDEQSIENEQKQRGTQQQQQTTKADEDKQIDQMFVYQSDFDTNGICYALGTTFGQNEWTNPAQLKLINVKASKPKQDSKPINCVVGRSLVRCLTDFDESASITIHFGKRLKIKATHYTLRHFESRDTEALRNWNFEGSNDGVNWTLISEHKNDETLNEKGKSHTWDVPETKKDEAKTTDGYFSIFRIRMTGPNSNDNYYLACSGFE
eukprot:721256_1